jgi:hypothetical protein
MPLPEKEITRGGAEAAATVLKIEESIDTVTIETVKAAYRQALRDVHPDGGSLASNAGDLIFAARKAKELLQVWIELRPDPACLLCNGTGHIKGSAFASRPCPRCTKGRAR